ncbi:MAG: DUF1841 family protein [Myxococcota bacterium]
MDEYTPNEPIDAEAWMALDDAKKIELITAFHEQETDHPLPENMDLHARIHCIVEDQVAADEGVRGELERLVVDGLSRHNALHALGNVALEHITAAQKEGRGLDDDAYRKGLAMIDAKTWGVQV